MENAKILTQENITSIHYLKGFMYENINGLCTEMSDFWTGKYITRSRINVAYFWVTV